MTKQAAKAAGGKWAHRAFPDEAAEQYGDIPIAKVIARVAEAEKAMAGEDWEVVDGFSYPYAKSA